MIIQNLKTQLISFTSDPRTNQKKKFILNLFTSMNNTITETNGTPIVMHLRHWTEHRQDIWCIGNWPSNNTGNISIFDAGEPMHGVLYILHNSFEVTLVKFFTKARWNTFPPVQKIMNILMNNLK